MMNEQHYGVWLQDRLTGSLLQRGDFTQFRFAEEYVNDPQRHVLGLMFEGALARPYGSALRVPAWFSNLLPEGRLREWVAVDRKVSADREMELLAQVGQDLPGAVRVFPTDQPGPNMLGSFPAEETGASEVAGNEQAWKFSLAGVGIKFSMVRQGERLTIPASGLGGDWIVKLPDPLYQDVPLNEYSMMNLAERVGIEVPERILVHREALGPVPDGAWQSEETHAYAIKRFDRAADRALIHIEDFAQVRGVYPDRDKKYSGNFETVAALAYRGRDQEALREFVRRHVFNILISNGDAHLKNWSLIYRDPRVPTLSPVYDLVSTQIYSPNVETSALKFHSTVRFDQFRLRDFDRLERKLEAPNLGLADLADETISRIRNNWPEIESTLADKPELRQSVSSSIDERSATLRKST
jgi:serine/threonine-protein kinase HipA